MVANADEGQYADDDEGKHGGRWEVNGGVPIAQNR